MHYPIAIKEGNDDTAWSIVVPDLLGCFSAADSGIDEALSNAREAMLLWIEVALDEGRVIPTPKLMETHQKHPAFEGWDWLSVEVDLAPYVKASELRLALKCAHDDIQHGRFEKLTPEAHLSQLEQSFEQKS